MNNEKNTLYLSLPINKINSDDIQNFILEAKKRGFKKIDFTFGDQTKVNFAVMIVDDFREGSSLIL
jgi:hypothetical protein